MTPLHLVLLTFAVVCAACWVLSLVTNEHSWVDRMWSITPVIYVFEFARGAHFHNVRLNVMAIIVFAWGARLTFNFARKGGYSGEEDYRWPVLRASMKKWQFQLFNIFFIVLYQNFLLVLISLPALTAYEHQSLGFNGWDLTLVVIFVLFLMVRPLQINNNGISKRVRRSSSQLAEPHSTASSQLDSLSSHAIPITSLKSRSGGSCI